MQPLGLFSHHRALWSWGLSTRLLKQKGVDMRIGLDIAWLATKRLVDAIALVTGDSDFIAAIEVSAQEGIRIYLGIYGTPGLRSAKSSR